MVHTPLGFLISLLTGTLHDVVAEDVGNLDGVVDLETGVNADAAVLVKVPAGLSASS
jgi:hypothetical protein